MAVSIANITSGFDEDGGSSSTTASYTPTANKLQLLTVASRTGISTDPNQPTVTGDGLTWVVINSIVYDTSSSSRRRVTLFRALGSSPSAGVLTIDFGGQAQTDVTWIVDETTGMDTSGTDGSGAIVQSVTGKDESGTATSLTITLAAFGSTDNATYGSFGWDGSPTQTAGTGFTEIDEQHDSVSDVACGTEFRADNDTSVDASYSSAVLVGGIAIEIKAASVAGVSGNDWPIFTGKKFWGPRYS